MLCIAPRTVKYADTLSLAGSTFNFDTTPTTYALLRLQSYFAFRVNY